MSEEEKAIQSPHHDSRGKFIAGNKAGTGKSYIKQAMNQFRASLLKAVTPERFARIVEKQIEQAEEGDNDCAERIFRYCVGDPKKLDSDGSGGAGYTICINLVEGKTPRQIQVQEGEDGFGGDTAEQA